MDYVMRSLVVGINEYADSRYRDSSYLQYAKSDAVSIAQVLRESTAFHLEFDHPHLLTNQKASADAVREIMNNLFSTERLNRRTIALFYFAGHGIWKDGRVFLCCHDVDFSNPKHGGIELDQIYRWLTTSSADCTIAILDACFSGGFTNNAQDSASIAEQVRRSFVEARNPDGKTIAIFAACQSNQQAREDRELGHGLFTHRLLQGWHGDGIAKDPDGFVTLSSLYRYLDYRFKNEPQQPKLNLARASSIPLWKLSQPIPEISLGITPELLRPGSTRSLPAASPKLSTQAHQISYLGPEAHSRPNTSHVGPFQLEAVGSHTNEINPFRLENPITSKPRKNGRNILIFISILILLLLIVFIKIH